MCGTDVKMYAKPPFADPVIMGTRNGMIARPGHAFAERQGIREGDRVFVQHTSAASSATGAGRGSTGTAS